MIAFKEHFYEKYTENTTVQHTGENIKFSESFRGEN